MDNVKSKNLNHQMSASTIEENQYLDEYDPEEAGLPGFDLYAREAYEALSHTEGPIATYNDADRIAWESLYTLLMLDSSVAAEPIPDADATRAMHHLSGLLPFSTKERARLVSNMLASHPNTAGLDLNLDRPGVWNAWASDEDLVQLERWRRWLVQNAPNVGKESGVHEILGSLADFRQAISHWLPPVEQPS